MPIANSIYLVYRKDLSIWHSRRSDTGGGDRIGPCGRIRIMDIFFREKGQMSVMRALPGIRGLCILAAAAAIMVAAFPGIGAGQAPKRVARPPAPPDVATSAAHPSIATQNHPTNVALMTLWSSYIWKSIPVSDLRSPTPSPVIRAYEANGWQPIFINSKFGLDSKADSLLARLRTVDQDAMDPRPFKLDSLSEMVQKLNGYRSALRTLDPKFDDSRARSFFDAQRAAASSAEANRSNEPSATKTANIEVIAKDYRLCFQEAGKADVRLTTDFFLFSQKMDRFSPFQNDLKVLLSNTPFSSYFKELEPKEFDYAALRSAYRKYRELAARGDQQSVYVSSPARLGNTGEAIRLLQIRLRQEGFYKGRITGVYNRETQHAVRQFQTEHMLTADGVVGRRTIKWLNVPFKHKAALIAYSLKAVRNSPSRRFKRFIRINIPQYMLGYYKDGRLEKADKVVVGRASGKKVDRRGKLVGENQTPTFVSQIYEIVFNPRWYVDGRIWLELNAEAKSNPDWFEEHGYVKMESRYASGEHRLFQKSGPQNALGRVKFEFLNPYTVYLHDTPEKYLFDKSRRDFSHGCIRVDNALQLAHALLQDDGNPYGEKMHSILKGTRQVFVKLSKPVPISVEYIPVVAEANGRIVFAGDPYGMVSQPTQSAKSR